VLFLTFRFSSLLCHWWKIDFLVKQLQLLFLFFRLLHSFLRYMSSFLYSCWRMFWIFLADLITFLLFFNFPEAFFLSTSALNLLTIFLTLFLTRLLDLAFLKEELTAFTADLRSFGVTAATSNFKESEIFLKFALNFLFFNPFF